MPGRLTVLIYRRIQWQQTASAIPDCTVKNKVKVWFVFLACAVKKLKRKNLP